MPKSFCKKCGIKGNCFCMIVDDEQVVNEFTFLCNSGHVLKECRYVDESCPFCNLSAKDHQETPASLWSKK
jgi:hypothetical protein